MSKRIIFCADGTWDDAASNSNVYRIFKAMNYTAAQCPIYDDGVGSDGNTFLRILGGAAGEGLDQKIKDGYTRISHLYEHGDEIFLFGFSRGAYTARSLGGMITLCGLPTQNVDDQQTELAFAAYRQHSDMSLRQQQLAALKQRYAPDDVDITMIGVWDTVGALGVPALIGGIDLLRYGFLDTALHPNVKHAYHALSVDERRQEFPATLWTGPFADGQVVEQIYFAGVHCDVGGGYGDSQLSEIPLAWMMSKAKALGVDFDPVVYQQCMQVDPRHALDPKHESWSFKWLEPKIRLIDPHASISKTVQQRLLQDASYQPGSLKHSGGVLDSGYIAVDVVAQLAQSQAAGKP